MPYKKPRKVDGWVLPKKRGGVHRSKTGKVVHFKSAAKAKRSGQFINAIEHGFVPTRLGKAAKKAARKSKRIRKGRK